MCKLDLVGYDDDIRNDENNNGATPEIRDAVNDELRGCLHLCRCTGDFLPVDWSIVAVVFIFHGRTV